MKNLRKKIQLGQNLVFVTDQSPQGWHWEGVEVELDVEDHEVLPGSATDVIRLLDDDTKTAPQALRQVIQANKTAPGLDDVQRCIRIVKAMSAHPSQAAWKTRRNAKVS